MYLSCCFFFIRILINVSVEKSRMELCSWSNKSWIMTTRNELNCRAHLNGRKSIVNIIGRAHELLLLASQKSPTITTFFVFYQLYCIFRWKLVLATQHNGGCSRGNNKQANSIKILSIRRIWNTMTFLYPHLHSFTHGWAFSFPRVFH